jgi:hypothetical protein
MPSSVAPVDRASRRLPEADLPRRVEHLTRIRCSPRPRPRCRLTRERAESLGSQVGSLETRHQSTATDARRTTVQVTRHASTPIDTAEKPTDQKVGGSNPSERARTYSPKSESIFTEFGVEVVDAPIGVNASKPHLSSVYEPSAQAVDRSPLDARTGPGVPRAEGWRAPTRSGLFCSAPVCGSASWSGCAGQT